MKKALLIFLLVILCIGIRCRCRDSRIFMDIRLAEDTLGTIRPSGAMELVFTYRL